MSTISIFRTTAEVSSNFTLLKYIKSQRSYGFLITKELIFGFQILDLKDHFSASLPFDWRNGRHSYQLKIPADPQATVNEMVDQTSG